MIVNKIDLASAAELALIRTTLRAINPAAVLVAATYGVPSLDETAVSLTPVSVTAAPSGALHHSHADEQRDQQYEHDHAHDHAHQAALGLQSWSSALSAPCDPQGLHTLLQAVVMGSYGQVVRVKGIARAGGGWIHFDVAGGKPSMAAFAPREGEEPRVVAIGRGVDEAGLRAAFDACSLPAAA